MANGETREGPRLPRCFRTEKEHIDLPWPYCDQRGCGWMRPQPPKPPTLAEEQVAEILKFCDDAEQVYQDAGFVVPGVDPKAALVSTHGIRTMLKHVANRREREAKPGDGTSRQTNDPSEESR